MKIDLCHEFAAVKKAANDLKESFWSETKAWQEEMRLDGQSPFCSVCLMLDAQLSFGAKVSRLTLKWRHQSVVNGVHEFHHIPKKRGSESYDLRVLLSKCASRDERIRVKRFELLCRRIRRDWMRLIDIKNIWILCQANNPLCRDYEVDQNLGNTSEDVCPSRYPFGDSEEYAFYLPESEL